MTSKKPQEKKTELPETVDYPFAVDFPAFRPPKGRILMTAAVVAGLAFGFAAGVQRVFRRDFQELSVPLPRNHQGQFASPREDFRYGRSYVEEVEHLGGVAVRIRRELKKVREQLGTSLHVKEVSQAELDRIQKQTQDLIMHSAGLKHRDVFRDPTAEPAYGRSQPSETDHQEYNRLVGKANTLLNRVLTLSDVITLTEDTARRNRERRADYDESVDAEAFYAFIVALIAFCFAAVTSYSKALGSYESDSYQAKARNMKALGYRRVYEPASHFGYNGFPSRTYWVRDKEGR